MNALLNLLPFVAGGLVGFASSYFTQRLNDASEWKNKRAEKLEALVTTLFEHDHWLESMRNAGTLDYGKEPGISPFAKVQAICVVYFPHFEKMIEELGVVGGQYEGWMLSCAQKRLDGQDVAKIDEGYEDARGPYAQKFASVLAEVKKYSKREFAKE